MNVLFLVLFVLKGLDATIFQLITYEEHHMFATHIFDNWRKIHKDSDLKK